MHRLRELKTLFTFLPILTAGLILAAAPLYATPLLNVYLPDRTAFHALTTGGFDIASIEADHANVVGWPEDMIRLDRDGLAYTIAIDNLESFYAGRLDHELNDMGGYPTFDEIAAWVDTFTADHSNIVARPDTAGYGLENRPLLAFKISDNPDVDEEGETEIFLNAAIHAREVVTPLVLENFAQLLVDGYGTDPRITALVDTCEIWIMPVVNPDGYAYNGEIDPNGGGMWRKNKRTIDGILYGVDLNRNFPYMWGIDDEGSSPDPSNPVYRGASAGSEPETQGMMAFVNDHHFASVLNYHSYSNLILIPWGYTYDLPPDYALYLNWGNYLNQTLDWTVGGADVIYLTNGGAEDWQEGGADYPMYSFTFEVGTEEDGFWPTMSRKDILVQQQEEPLLRFCEVSEHPSIVMPPQPPVVLLPDTVESAFNVRWSPVPDTAGLNNAVSFDVMELGDIIHEDHGDNADLYAWDLNRFSLSLPSQPGQDGVYSCNLGNSETGTLTSILPYEVQDGDILLFDASYDIEDGYDYAYVQVSTDGYTFTSLAGSITSTDDPYGANRGNGITGSSNGSWVNAAFPLGDYVGQKVYFRFKYVTDQWVTGSGLEVRNIRPMIGFQTHELLATTSADTFLAVDKTDLMDTIDRWYAVRAYDMQGDVSAWSDLAPTVILPSTGVASTDPVLPATFAVGDVYPNPFNPTTTLTVTLPQAARGSVTVFDVLGRRTAELALHSESAGHETFTLDGRSWATGIYFVVVDARGVNGAVYHAVRKAVLVK